MSVAVLLERLKSRGEALFKEVLEEASEREVTLLLFGSRARGDYNILSDYDLLAIHRGTPLEGRGLIVNVFNVDVRELDEEVYRSPLVFSAVMTGHVILDKLNIKQHLSELRRRLTRDGGRVEGDKIILPKRTAGS